MTLNANANGIVTSTNGFLKIILLQNAAERRERNKMERKRKKDCAKIRKAFLCTLNISITTFN